MLRYYWVNGAETVDVKMSSTTLPYFYEYLGAGGVLVIHGGFLFCNHEKF